MAQQLSALFWKHEILSLNAQNSKNKQGVVGTCACNPSVAQGLGGSQGLTGHQPRPCSM